MRHTKKSNCTSEKEGRSGFKRKARGDTGKAKLRPAEGGKNSKKKSCENSSPVSANPGCDTRENSSRTPGQDIAAKKKTFADAESGSAGDGGFSSLPEPPESSGVCSNDGGGAGKQSRTSSTSSALLGEVPFHSCCNVCNGNSALCTSPSSSSHMHESNLEHETSERKIDEGVFGPSGKPGSQAACSKADLVCSGTGSADNCSASGNLDKIGPIAEVSRKIDQMAKSLMEKPAHFPGHGNHAQNKSVVCSDSGAKVNGIQTRKRDKEVHTRREEERIHVGERSDATCTSPKRASAGTSTLKAQHRIFFTSEGTKNANTDAPVLLVNLSQGNGGSVGRSAQERNMHKKAPCNYENKTMVSVHSESVVEKDDLDTSPGDVRLIKTKLKDTIRVECSTPRHFGTARASGDHTHAPGGDRTTDAKHPQLRGSASHKDSLCDLVDRFSTKNNSEDVCAPIIRDVHYVDSEVLAKDRKRGRKGFLCTLFSNVFGCCT